MNKPYHRFLCSVNEYKSVSYYKLGTGTVSWMYTFYTTVFKYIYYKVEAQSTELTRGPPELAQHFRL